MREQRRERRHATSVATAIGAHDSRRRRRTIFVAVLCLSLVILQLYRQPFALAIPLGHEAQSVIDRLLAPPTIAASGQPNAAAFRIARMLGHHVGEEGLRRRARRIQDLMQTVGPIAGLAATALGSLYAGLKGIMGA